MKESDTSSTLIKFLLHKVNKMNKDPKLANGPLCEWFVTKVNLDIIHKPTTSRYFPLQAFHSRLALAILKCVYKGKVYTSFTSTGMKFSHL